MSDSDLQKSKQEIEEVTQAAATAAARTAIKVLVVPVTVIALTAAVAVWVGIRLVLVEKATIDLTRTVLELETLPVDSDNDGFSDALENAGFSLSASSRFYSTCAQGIDRARCVDPGSKDLFVVLKHNSPSLIEQDPNIFEFVSNSREDGGLGIAVHQIEESEVWGNHQVTPDSNQVAVMVVEDLTMHYDTQCTPLPDVVVKMGETLPEAGPSGYERMSLIYTRNILSRVDQFCKNLDPQNDFCKDVFKEPYTEGEPGDCDADGTWTLDPLDKLFIKQVIAHETAHNLNLAVYEGSHHSRVEEEFVMEEHVQNPKYSKKRKTMEWEIPTVFCEPCYSGVDMTYW